MDWHDTLRLDGNGSLHGQIKRAIARPIRERQWLPGDRVPSEHDLLEHFAASRMTVNRALRELADEGLIVRHRRTGSFVASPPAPISILEIVDMSALIPKRDQRYRYELISRALSAVDAEVAARLSVEPGTKVLHVRCRHFADDEVVELEDRWINPAAAPGALAKSFATIGPSHWLLSEVPWSEAEHVILAVNADRNLAHLLDVPDGTACLVLERRTFQVVRVVTFARLVHPGSRHILAQRFTPGRG